MNCVHTADADAMQLDSCVASASARVLSLIRRLCLLNFVQVAETGMAFDDTILDEPDQPEG